MRLHLTFSEEMGTCTTCQAEVVVRSAHVLSDAGVGESPALCEECWEMSLTQRGVPMEVSVDPPAKRTAPSKRDKKHSTKQDLRMAARSGGRLQPGSGNQDDAKGDVRVKGKYRIEDKFTRAASFSLTREILNKIRGECEHGEKPVLGIEFCNKNTLKVEDEWVVMQVEDWEEMVRVIDEHQRSKVT